MKNLWAIALLLLATSLSAAPVLIEAYQEGMITIPGDEIDTVTVVELSFSVDTACYVQFTAGGLLRYLAETLLELDENYLFPIAIIQGNTYLSALIVYTYLISAGEHTVRLKGTRVGGATASFYHSYLQALIFLPDAESTVAEPPGDNHQPQAYSIVSKGPYVNVAGATELVDASGRVIKNAIEADKVFIATLPTGTYFARSEERTIVKIVKVE